MNLAERDDSVTPKNKQVESALECSCSLHSPAPCAQVPGSRATTLALAPMCSGHSFQVPCFRGSKCDAPYSASMCQGLGHCRTWPPSGDKQSSFGCYKNIPRLRQACSGPQHKSCQAECFNALRQCTNAEQAPEQ